MSIRWQRSTYLSLALAGALAACGPGETTSDGGEPEDRTDGAVAADAAGNPGAGTPTDAQAGVSTDGPAGTQTDAETGGAAEDWGTTYYVRPDGGDAAQCTGTVNAPYPGTGTAQPCAWVHPFVALPPSGASRIAGGDRLVIGAGQYRMGYGAPNTETCAAAWAYDCVPAAVPSGPDASHPTRIVGAGYDTGCAAPPELWGAERIATVLDLTGTSHARVECLEITDHSSCVEAHPTLRCTRDQAPFGDWASAGITATDSQDVTLRHLNVHGLAHTGIWAGRLTDWTVEDVRIAGNGWVGWDGDVSGDDSNSGTLRFTRWTVEWNGCGETYPGGEPTGCWGQSAGGYGDGVGTGATGGDWVITDSAFLHNTSDGLDLLYHSGPGTITVERVRAMGNAGNQIKTRGPAMIRNSVVVGNCGFFQDKPFTYNVDNCRAYGNAMDLNITGDQQLVLVNNTVYSEGDCLMVVGCDGGQVTSRNNVYLAGPDYLQPDEQSCLLYHECSNLAVSYGYDIVDGTKDGCPTGTAILCADPQLVSESPETFDGHLTPGSPACDSGAATGGYVPSTDIDGVARPRGAGVDRGAYEQ